MDDGHDGDPTPPDRLPVYGPAFDSASRRPHTPVAGAPVYVVERPSRRMEAVGLEDVDAADETLGSLGRVVDVIIARRTSKAMRGLRAGIISALIAAVGALAGVAKGALDAREAAGVDKTRIRQLELEVDRLRSAVFPAPPPYWRRDDAPTFPTAPAPQMRAPDPSQRGLLP